MWPRDEREVSPIRRMRVLLTFRKVFGDRIVVPAQRKLLRRSFAGTAIEADDAQGSQIDSTSTGDCFFNSESGRPLVGGSVSRELFGSDLDEDLYLVGSVSGRACCN